MLASGFWSGAKFSVDFVLVDMEQELVKEAVGTFQFEDLVGRQERRQAFLPVVVTAFDFTLGLRRWSIAKSDAVEVESGAQLSEGIGSVSKEEGVIIHVENQRQAMGVEGTGQEV